MDIQNPVGPQPDTQRMIQSVHSFGEELAKLPNVPALAQGNAIQHTLDQILTLLTQLTQLTQTHQTQLTQLAQTQQTQQTQLTQINAKLDALTLRISAR